MVVELKKENMNWDKINKPLCPEASIQQHDKICWFDDGISELSKDPVIVKDHLAPNVYVDHHRS